MNRLDTLTWRDSSSNVVASYDYDILADGQRKRVTELGGTVTQWDYDNLNRLTNENVSAGYSHQYTYDLTGNRFKFDNGTEVTYCRVNAQDQVIAESPNADYTDPSVTYGYDANGSLESKAVAGGATTVYDYNLQNRMASATIGVNPSITYAYDVDGFRVSKQTGISPVNMFLVDASNPTGYAQVLRDESGSYVIGSDIIAQNLGGAVAYYIYDGQGSVRHLTDANGALISGQNFSYDGYGNRTDTSVEQTNLQYTGEWHDADLDWTYNRDRWSIPSLGIFNQMDRYSGNPNDPQSLHKYLYCYSDPINNADPMGLFSAAFGRLAHQAIQGVYASDLKMKGRKDNVIYGKWARFGGVLSSTYKLKPDIFNMTKKSWLEIKPLSISGVADGVFSYEKYSNAFAPVYQPEASWIPSTHIVNVGVIEVFFFNAGGIIFYTDVTENTDELMALGSAVAVKQYLRSAVGKIFTHSIVNTSSQVPKLVKTRAVADRERLKQHLQIAAMLMFIGHII